jgi:hypothetical protein
MLMIVFGAGASYDSSTDYSPSVDRVTSMEGNPIVLRGVRPPLADQLFELRQIFASAAEKIPKCELILNQLRNRQSDASVEQQLEKLRQQALKYPEGQRQLVSVRFYLQWTIAQCQSEWNRIIHSHTTYRALLGQVDRQLKGEPVCLVTFNYDTLLEEAFVSLDMGFKSLNDYISSNNYKVIKLHGSVNWARELSSPMEASKLNHLQMANDLIAQADGLQPSDRYHFIPEDNRREWLVSYMQVPGKPGFQAVFPAIAIPLEKKTEYECPPEHINVLTECISKTDKLLIIGWKGAEESFVKLLVKGLKKSIPIMVVSRSRDSADRICGALVASGIDGENWVLAERGFSDEIRSGAIENFVRSTSRG